MSRHDAIVIGAGPAGCIAALALARAGAGVLVLEAAGRESDRFAGEWVHPPGVAVLDFLGIDLSDVCHTTGRGFVVYPDDGSAPIVLPYAHGDRAFVCEHRLLVRALRSAVQAHADVDILLDSRVTSVNDGEVRYLDATGAPRNARTQLIVGADGKSSLVRRSLGCARPPTPTSQMAGFLLHDVELPYESFGHVLLGGPGPVLLYRISPELVRVCIDVPIQHARNATISDFVRRHYAPVFPPSLLDGLNESLSHGRPQWAANRESVRIAYGREGQALVGDATGYYHPFTAAGMTLAFADAECLARVASVEEYSRERSRRTVVSEMLAMSLYRVLSNSGPAEQNIRQSVYRDWRRDPMHGTVTMRLLSTDEQRLHQLGRMFIRAVVHAFGDALRDLVATRNWVRYGASMGGFVLWLRWLCVATVRRSSAVRYLPKRSQ